VRQVKVAEWGVYCGQELKKPGTMSGLFQFIANFLLVEEAELLLEARNASAAVKNGLGAAGPSRMGFGIDIQRQRIAILAIG
jgi:hypothetical protein